jgi:hypothetical protein
MPYWLLIYMIEAGAVELVFSNRKSPLLITVEEPLVLAARLEKVHLLMTPGTFGIRTSSSK